MNEQDSLYESFSLVFTKTTAVYAPVNFLNELKQIFQRKVNIFMLRIQRKIFSLKIYTFKKVLYLMAIDHLHDNESEIKAIFEENKVDWRRAYNSDDHKVSV